MISLNLPGHLSGFHAGLGALPWGAVVELATSAPGGTCFVGVVQQSDTVLTGPLSPPFGHWLLSALRFQAGMKTVQDDDPSAAVPVSSLGLPGPIERQWCRLERQIEHLMNRFGQVESNLQDDVRKTYQAEFDELILRLNFWEQERGNARTLPPDERARYEDDIQIGQSLLGDRLLRFAALVFSEPLPTHHRAARGLRRRLLSRSPSSTDTPPSLRPQPAGVVQALVNHDVGYGRSLELRYHQEEALSAIKGWMASQQEARTSGLADTRFLETTVVMPVGGGKTRTMAAAFAATIEEKIFRVGDKLIVVNHTDQIHGQNLEVLERLRPYFKKKTGRELKITEYKADTKDLSGDMVVVSVPTVNNEEKRRIFKSDLKKALGAGGRIAMTAVDEVHHLEMGKSSGREMWEELLKTLREVDGSFFQIGFTATPTGKEGRVIYRLREQELMQTGVTPRTYEEFVEGLLKGEGWARSQWFLRRLATLLYQGREVFVEAWNRALGREERERKIGRIDTDRMLACLEKVLREAGEKGERLTPRSAAARTHARYGEGLPEEEVRPSQRSFRNLISLNEKSSNPRAREVLQASPVIQRQTVGRQKVKR